jgi:hypothetical protein
MADQYVLSNGGRPKDGAGEGAEERLAALLRDLAELGDYLAERGRRTYDLAQRFLDNARRDESSRAYDVRQATMLEYHHSILSSLVSQKTCNMEW